jgi:5,10-methylenetetrahydromethanopterin reductase
MARFSANHVKLSIRVFHSSATNNFRAPVNAVASIRKPATFVLDEREQKVLEEIRHVYNYYEHMQQTASQAQVIPDWLVDKFAIAGTRAECRAQVERLRKTGINQIGLIPYGAGGGDREETLKEFVAAVSYFI